MTFHILVEDTPFTRYKKYSTTNDAVVIKNAIFQNFCLKF